MNSKTDTEKVLTAYVNVFSWHSFGDTENNHKNKCTPLKYRVGVESLHLEENYNKSSDHYFFMCNMLTVQNKTKFLYI
jgi:hypothetical protein